MGMALMVDPRLMLLDEPTAGLSPAAAERLFAMIRAIASDGIAIALVEQNALHALMVSDRAYILVDGRNARTGRAKEIAAIPTSAGSSLASTRLRTRTGCKREGIMNTEHSWTRRSILKAMAGASALGLSPNLAFAQQGGPLRLGGLVPLTGAGGIWGPSMVLIYKTIVDEVNAAGGIGGQKVEFYAEDDQTNPDAGVLAVRKLIDINRVSAIMGVWSSAVAAPTLPLCWQNKVAMLAIAASNSLSELPHQGYFIRTNVHVALQGKEIGEWAVGKGAKSIFVLLAQTPFSVPMMQGLENAVQSKGVKTDSLTYDMRKTSFRSEVDQALRMKPDVILLGGYPQDNIVIMKDLLPGRV